MRIQKICKDRETCDEKDSDRQCCTCTFDGLDIGHREHRAEFRTVDRDRQPQHKKFLTSRHEDRGGHRYRDHDRHHYRDDHPGRGWKDKHRGHHPGHGYGWKKKHAWKHKKHHYRDHHGHKWHKRHWRDYGHRHHRYDRDGRVRYHFSYNTGLDREPGGFFSIDLRR